jgi:hypothetical protein
VEHFFVDLGPKFNEEVAIAFSNLPKALLILSCQIEWDTGEVIYPFSPEFFVDRTRALVTPSAGDHSFCQPLLLAARKA